MPSTESGTWSLEPGILRKLWRCCLARQVNQPANISLLIVTECTANTAITECIPSNSSQPLPVLINTEFTAITESTANTECTAQYCPILNVLLILNPPRWLTLLAGSRINEHVFRSGRYLAQ